MKQHAPKVVFRDRRIVGRRGHDGPDGPDGPAGPTGPAGPPGSGGGGAALAGNYFTRRDAAKSYWHFPPFSAEGTSGQSRVTGTTWYCFAPILEDCNLDDIGLWNGGGWDGVFDAGLWRCDSHGYPLVKVWNSKDYGVDGLKIRSTRVGQGQSKVDGLTDSVGGVLTPVAIQAGDYYFAVDKESGTSQSGGVVSPYYSIVTHHLGDNGELAGPCLHIDEAMPNRDDPWYTDDPVPVHKSLLPDTNYPMVIHWKLSI